MVNLSPGESVQRTNPVTWITPGGPREGVLSLTNQGIIFEGPVPPQGPMGRGPMRPGMGMRGPPGGFRGGMSPRGPPPLSEGVLRIPFWRCRNASVAASPQGTRLQLELLQRTLFFQTPEPEAWAASINQLRANAPPPPPGAMGGGMGGRAPQPRCDYCGNLSAVGATKCEHCGAPF